MTTTRGSAVKHAVISATDFGNLSEKDENTIYFVGNSSGMNLYKGAVKIAGDKDTVSNVPGFAVLGSNPSNTTGMSEGVLYLAPNGKLYYKNGSTLSIAVNLIQASELTESNNADLVPSVAAMYSAIAAKIAAAMTGTYRSSILAPVADVTALKAISTKQDKDVVFVESLNALFSYDAQSSVTADDTTVVTPTSGGGRWLKTQAGFSYSSSDFQWGSSGLELKGSVPLVVDALPTASSSTVGKLYVLTADNKMYLGVEDTSGAETTYALVAIAGASTGASSTLINTVSSNPAVSSSNNGETYFNTSTGRTYVVESGSLVQKTYSKSDVDDLVSWYTIANS